MSATRIRIPKRRTARGRLIAAARMIEQHPENHDQDTWVAGPGSPYGLSAVELSDSASISCGTTCCAAGWGIATTPGDLLPRGWRGTSYIDAGANAFGLDYGAASVLFYSGSMPAKNTAKVLRDLAALSSADRAALSESDMERIIKRRWRAYDPD